MKKLCDSCRNCLKKMQMKIIAKKKINSNNYKTIKFDEIYKLIIILSQIEKCHQKLEKSKNADVMRKLIYQHETSLKTDSIVMKADKMLSNAQKAELNHQKKKMRYQKKKS